METRWHVPGGLKLSETKIEDRIKELHISSNRMSAITAQLTRTEIAEAEVKSAEDKQRLMKHISDEMTKNWSDSIQKQQAEKHAHLHELLHKQDDLNLIKYLKVKKDQEDDKKQFVDEMRQKIMVQQDFPKTLASAYLFSEVLYERDKQKEFKKTVQQHHNDENREEYEAMVADCKSFVIEEAERKKKLKEKNYAHAEELMEQMTVIQEARKKERAMQIEEELTDQQRARLEADRIEMVRKEKITKTRKYANDALVDFMEVQRIEHEKERNADRETQEVTKIIQRSNDRIRTMMKTKAKEMTEARFAKGAKAFDNSKQLKRDSEIKLIYERGFEKKEANDKARNERRAAKQVRLRQEREDQQKQVLSDNQAKKMQEEDLFRWEMMNRFKSNDEELARVEACKKQKYENRELLVKHYDMDVQLKKERLKRENPEHEEFREHLAQYKSDDKINLEHAEEVKAQVLENGWNTYPIDIVITNYRQKMMEEKRPKRCEKLREELCANKGHFNEEPGKRTHCPSTDPSIKCKHQKEHLYK